MTVIIIQPDAAAGVDNALSESGPLLNQGSANFLSCRTTVGGRQRPIIRFDLSPLVGFVMARAELWLFLAGSAPATLTTVTVNRILPANSEWTELDSRWNYQTAGRPWAGDVDGLGGPDAGCSIAGTDYEATPIGVAQIPALSPADYHLRIGLNLTQLAAMIAADNYGFVIAGDNSSGMSFRSSDYGLADPRPALAAFSPSPLKSGDAGLTLPMRMLLGLE